MSEEALLIQSLTKKLNDLEAETRLIQAAPLSIMPDREEQLDALHVEKLKLQTRLSRMLTKTTSSRFIP